jgi:hypothetical protein
LNQQLEEVEMDLEYKDKQIKKFKFLQILHDYPTSASEILDKATNQNKMPERSSTLLPGSTKNVTSEDFGFFNQARPRDHRKSDAMFSHKPSLSSFTGANDIQLHGNTNQSIIRTSDPVSNEISSIINQQRNSKTRRNSTDI